MIKWDLFQKCKFDLTCEINQCKSHIKRLKHKHMITSVDTEKTFDRMKDNKECYLGTNSWYSFEERKKMIKCKIQDCAYL